MNYPSIRFIFDRKKAASKTSKGLVQIEILYKRRRKWIGTGIKLLSHQWDERYHVVRSPSAVVDNQTLDTIMVRVKDVVRSVIDEFGEFSFAVFSERYVNEDAKSFLDFISRELESSGLSPGTKTGHYSLLNALTEFGKLKTFDDVTLKGIEDFDAFLKADRYRVDGSVYHIKASSIHHFHSIVCKYVNLAVKAGYVRTNPYSTFQKDRKENTERFYLTEEEMKRFADTEVPKRLRKAKNMFLLQCYTGLSFVDFMTLDFRTCISNRGGKLVINGKRVKTRENYYIVIIPKAMQLIEESEYDFSSERILQTYNNHLNKVAALAGIDKKLTSHIGRHTFAVWALNNGISIEIVAKILGHTDIKTTQIYAKIVDKSVEDSFEKLGSML